MKGYRHHAYSAVFAALMLLGAPGAAMADCTSPAGIAGGITWNGTDSVIWCDGTNWYALKNAAGSSGNAGYIQFSNGSGGFSNSGTTAGQQLFWDDTNKRLGIGTTAPSAPIEISKSGAPSLILTNTVTNSYTILRYVTTGATWSVGVGNASEATINVANKFYIQHGSVTPTPRFVIDTTGYIGIGTASPTTPLSVATAQGTSGGILVADATDANNPRVQLRTSNPNGNGVIEVLDNTEAVKIQLHGNGASYINSGNVGIGTATPSGTLYVKGNTLLSDDTANVAAPYPLRVYSASSSSGLVNLYYQNADVNGAALSLQKYKSGGNEIAAGDILGSIDFFGTTGAGNSLRAAQIRATAETGWGGTGDAPGRLTFLTTPDGSSTAVERMRIDNAGNVGIGTTTPGALLDISQTADDTDIARFKRNSSQYLAVVTGAGGNIVKSYSSTGASKPMVFNATTDSSDTATTGTNSLGFTFQIRTSTKMVMDNVGNVGIGRTTPQATLDVNGYMRLAKNAAQPIACSATNDGAIALTSQYTLCACKGGSAAWVMTTDGTTACTW